MKVLVLGSGGREDAFLWKLSRSSYVEELYVSPGNGGSYRFASRVNLKTTDDILDFCRQRNIDIVVPGSENFIVQGIKDILEEHGIFTMAPSKRWSFLEGSKGKAKRFMESIGIPIPRYGYFETYQDAKDYILNMQPPYVIKADGLAGGKGVSIVHDRDEALRTLREYFEGRFGEASKKVVVEEYLDGWEVSAFIVMDGKHYRFLAYAKDYKRAYDGNRGPNTGGMGAYSPVDAVDRSLHERILKRIVEPTVSNIEGYVGFLFFGLMVVDGEPYVLEYNVRMGDPETQVILPRLENDLLEIILLAKESNLEQLDIKLEDVYALDVVIASKGYPESYEKGYRIQGLDSLDEDVLLFHAGTERKGEELITNGGRVMHVVGLGRTLEEARNKAYRNVQRISFENMFFRKDIGI